MQVIKVAALCVVIASIYACIIGDETMPFRNMQQDEFAKMNIVSVRAYGAVGDGVTDDTSAIQAAASQLNSNGDGTLLLPPGTYLVSGAINIGSKTTVVGYGATIKIATTFSDAEGAVFANYTGAMDDGNLTGAEDISFLNLTFTSDDKNNQTNTCVAICIGGTVSTKPERILLRDITVKDTRGTCVLIRDCNNVTVDNYKASGWISSQAVGLDFRGIHTGILSNFVIKDGGAGSTHGLLCIDWHQGEQDLIISNGIIDNVNGDGISFEENTHAPDNVQISDILLSNIGGQGIGEIGGDVRIENVQIDIADLGIYGNPTKAANVQLSNVRMKNISSTTHGAIYHSGSGTWQMSNVRIYNSEGYGIFAYGHSRVELNQVIVEDTQNDGVHISGCASWKLCGLKVVDGAVGASGYAAVNTSGTDYFTDNTSIMFTGATKPDYGFILPAVGAGQFLGNNYVEACNTARYRFGSVNYNQSLIRTENGKLIASDSAAPTSGTWTQGDIVYNTAPAADGAFGWVCVTGGSPGTWIPFAVSLFNSNNHANKLPLADTNDSHKLDLLWNEDDDTNRTLGFKVNGANAEIQIEGTSPAINQDVTSDASPQFAGLTLTGDISGVGGFKQPFSFMQSNVPASQTAVAMDVLGLSGNTEIVMPYAGSVIGISVASNEARSSGTLTVNATLNGTATALQAQLDGTNIQYHSATQAKDTNSFDVGDRLGVRITTDASWGPTTADIVITAIVEM